MKQSKLILVVCLSAVGAVALPNTVTAEEDDGGAVFVMTNAATDNKIETYARRENGFLQSSGEFATGGNGSGGTVDPLHSQGSLTLSHDHRLLFAVNAGSGTVSSFRVDRSSLTLIDSAPSGGSSPTAVAQSGDLVYVLNAGGNGNVSGLRLAGDGHLHPIQNSTRNLSDTATSPTSLAFSPNGQFLVVTETATNKIDVFRVRQNGTLGQISVNASAGNVPFAALFAPHGTLIVANNPSTTSISSYHLNWNQTLDVISDAIPTLGAATCWDVVLPNGRVVYTANAGTSNLSGFTIDHSGALAPISSTIVGANPAGSANIDTAVSRNGKFIYTLNAGTGAIGEFAVQSDGSLVRFGEVDGLPASAGLNGIAAY